MLILSSNIHLDQLVITVSSSHERCIIFHYFVSLIIVLNGRYMHHFFAPFIFPDTRFILRLISEKHLATLEPDYYPTPVRLHLHVPTPVFYPTTIADQ